MPEESLPFHSFAFTLLENKRPRKSLRMTAGEGGLYELHVQQGSSSNPSSQFTRQVPVEVAGHLRDVLQGIGAFGWEGSYGDAAAPGTRRWSLSIVFKKDVFSVESKGGSDAPSGFDELLEELYRLDFPRPSSSRGAQTATAAPAGLASFLNASGAGGLGGFGGLSVGDLSALAATGRLGGPEGLEGLGSLGDAGDLGQRMKEEFGRMSPAEQEQLLDMLASTGVAPRDWWERFLRG